MTYSPRVPFDGFEICNNLFPNIRRTLELIVVVNMAVCTKMLLKKTTVILPSMVTLMNMKCVYCAANLTLVLFQVRKRQEGAESTIYFVLQDLANQPLFLTSSAKYFDSEDILLTLHHPDERHAWREVLCLET